MWWVLLYVALGVLSIALLGLLTLRLWRQVRQLGRDVSAAGDRINAAMSEIEQISANRR
ncbi:MAG TPA: hypothetical protein VFH66_00695 [Mycobacteriales bacterium]|nr:hypothetical protein [Mycobacteriales bacterium]